MPSACSKSSIDSNSGTISRRAASGKRPAKVGENEHDEHVLGPARVTDDDAMHSEFAVALLDAWHEPEHLDGIAGRRGEAGGQLGGERRRARKQLLEHGEGSLLRGLGALELLARRGGKAAPSTRGRSWRTTLRKTSLLCRRSSDAK